MDNITVLVIDADEANRNFLGQLLQKKNYLEMSQKVIKMQDRVEPVGGMLP